MPTFLLLLLLAFVTVTSKRVQRDYVDLNSCFVYKKGYRLELNANDIESTESVQFKDDCLRACLRAVLSGGFLCRSLMHMPKDDDCVLTAVDGDKAVRTEEKPSQIPVNFYENQCAKVPIQGGMVEIRLRGYRGGEGVMQIVQKKGANPLTFIVMEGLPENREFDVLYKEDEVKDCFRMSSEEKQNAKKLLTIDSDASGMAVQPWSELNFHILTDAVLNKTIAVVDKITGNVITCGKITIKGKLSDWESAKNRSNVLMSSIWCILLIFVYLLR
uniref:Apple domain-containing protein n=1 Tax=Ascaris suum TaxID=6253 RepID=F1L7L8_ASCSU